MALIKCSECSREISDKAGACPQCGCPVPSSSKLAGSTFDMKWIEEEKQKMKNNKIMDDWDAQAESLDYAMGNAKANTTSGSPLRSIGIILLLAGLVFGIYAYQMTTTVTTEGKDFGYGISIPSMTINNLGLMEERRNKLMIAGVIFIAGAIFAAVGTKSK